MGFLSFCKVSKLKIWRRSKSPLQFFQNWENVRVHVTGIGECLIDGMTVTVMGMVNVAELITMMMKFEDNYNS